MMGAHSGTRRWLARSCAAAAAAACVLTGLAAPAQAAAYDLVVTAVRPAPVAGVQVTGARLTFSATIKNRGTAATPTGIVEGVAFSVDGRVVSWSDLSVGPLGPGQSLTVRANSGPSGDPVWVATNGRHVVTAVVDDVDRIKDESNETNNSRQVALTVGPVKPVVGLTAALGLTQEQFVSTHGKDAVVSWSVPPGQPVGTRYVVVEHAEDTSGSLCTSGPDVVTATTRGTRVATQLTTGAYCFGHSHGNRVRYSVEALAGDTIAASLSGVCDWFFALDSTSGNQLWRFTCDGGPTLTDGCERTQCLRPPAVPGRADLRPARAPR